MEPADVLGGAAASHIPVIVEVLEGIGDHRYEFMSAERFGVIALNMLLLTGPSFLCDQCDRLRCLAAGLSKLLG